MKKHSLTVYAPAKINLTLDIIGTNSDGFHEIATIFQAVSLFDIVTVTVSDSSGITISCDYPNIPLNENNIVYKAAELFFRETKINPLGLHIDIQKNIPAQAGLAGGSTDGAAVLTALNQLLLYPLSNTDLLRIGAKIGADVPFCIDGGTQLAKGIGTELTKLKDFPGCFIVICKPDISVSTAEAYRKSDLMIKKSFLYTENALKFLSEGQLQSFFKYMKNDFEDALCLEEISSIKSVMTQNKAQGSCLSGSGSAVFGIFSDEPTALYCADILKAEYRDVFLCKPVQKGVHAAPDARTIPFA